MAKKSLQTCSDLFDHVNVYTSTSAETGASHWVWRKCRMTLRGQCQFKVFTKTMVLEHLCVYKTY